MAITVDVAYKSLNKFNEVLCGDKVELLKTEDSNIMILADGMGSGVKANILATLTSKILGTMFLNGATLEECVETIVETLPICRVRQVAYSTFSILQVFHSGEAYLVEFDNPSCIFIRNGQLVPIPRNIREVQGKKINEYRFRVQRGDALILMSDGTVHAGVGQLLNFGWLWEDIAKYAVKQYALTISAMRLAAAICQACDELYQYRPGDDTTVACMRIISAKPVHLMTGPAQDPSMDEEMVKGFMSGDDSTKRIVCGGTSATIVSRVLKKKLDVSMDYVDPDIPPIAYMDGIELVTEGVLTLNRVVQLLRRYAKNETVSEDFFLELDKQNGASMVAKMLIEDCTELHLYVGKAINLHNRVRSYFRENIGRGPAIDQMVSLIARFEYIVTDSELEALVLENNLIKENSPKYNTLLKDDKTYPYIKVTVGEDYPRILFSRTMKKDKSRYFGPYTSAAAVKDTIELLNKLYQLRTCNRVLPRDTGLERPCLNYHIKQCLAPCQGYVSKEEYRQQVAGALEFLNGNYSPILKDLEEKMKKAAEAMEFEDAARYRDLLSSVRQVSQKQKITEGVGEDKDILALYQDETEAVVQVFFVRDGKLIGREHYYMTHVPENNKPAILQDFVKQFYAGTPFIPRELMLQYEIEDAELIEKWLSERKGSRVYLKVPKIGSKEKLVELAAQNAKLVLSQDREKLKREEGRTIGAVKEISDLLQLPLTGTARMEAYDISNINGFENVGSMVVYEKGKPKRSDYRKFKIKSVSGPDDYACMREVLTRRFRHGMEESKELEEQEMDQEYGSFTKFPDLILMDGGRGQVNIALSVLEELGIDIPVCGMVKDDNHRTRGLYYHNIELPIDTHSEGFKLITRIQDEAHRFAIEYHRSLRSKTQVKSVLDDIPGVGPARRKALMRHFKSLEEIRQASVEELMEIPEMNERTAEEIVTFFASQTGQPVVH